jgi:hypothetical protein
VVRPDEGAKITIKYRNIKEASLQVYRVDLMKLYLREKDLSRIRSVQLAGIEPEFSKTMTLGDGKDYVDKEREIDLSLEDEGAYLVIYRGDDLFSSDCQWTGARQRARHSPGHVQRGSACQSRRVSGEGLQIR